MGRAAEISTWACGVFDMRMIGAAVAAMALLLACGANAAPPPVEAYGHLPALEHVALSQDGLRVAYVAQAGDQRYIVVRNLADNAILQSISSNGRKVRTVQFADPDHLLILLSGTEDFGGDYEKYELPAVLALNLKTRKGYQLSPNISIEAQGLPLAVSHENGRVYGYFYSQRSGASDTGSHLNNANGLMRVDLDNQQVMMVSASTEHTAGYAVGPDGAIAGRLEEYDHGQEWRVYKGADSQMLLASGRSAVRTAGILAFGRTADTLLISRPADGDFSPLREISLADGKIAEPLVDGVEASPLRDRKTRLLIGFSMGGTVEDAVFLDPKIEARWKGVRAAFKGEKVELITYDDALNRWIVFVEGPHDSGRYLLVDLAAAKASFVGAPYPEVKPEDVGAFSWFEYKAADGTALRGVLTLPPGRDPHNLPFVMLPHGGPAGHETPGFDWWAQALAGRGYAVFQPEFRGSDGFGTAFERAGWSQWGKKMQTDVSDAIPALAAQGIIDPKRGCIVGWSYGGYATLAGVTLQNGLYRCAAAGGAVSDLGAMLNWEQARNGRLSPVMRYWHSSMGLSGPGDPVAATISPARLAASDQVPVMLLHGKDDTVVPFEQATEMRDALTRAGKPVELVTLQGTDHWLLEGATRTQMLQAMTGFLAKYNPPDVNLTPKVSVGE